MRLTVSDGAIAVISTVVSRAPGGIDSLSDPTSSTPPSGPTTWATESAGRGAQRTRPQPQTGRGGGNGSAFGLTPVGARSPQASRPATSSRRVAFTDCLSLLPARVHWARGGVFRRTPDCSTLRTGVTRYA